MSSVLLLICNCGPLILFMMASINQIDALISLHEIHMLTANNNYSPLLHRYAAHQMDLLIC